MAAEIVKQSQLGIPIGNKIVLGQLTSFKDGSAKWTYAKDTNPLIAGGGDRSTFTSSKDANGKWNWSPTTSTSVPNLASREGITEEEVKKSLYTTPQTQTVLNAGRNTQLGLTEAKKLGLPGATGTAVVTGKLPSEVSGGFSNQEGATNLTGGDTQNDPGKGSEATEQDLKSGLDIAAGIGGQIKDSGKTRPVGAYGNLRYPLTLKSEEQDCIKFTMLSYSPKPLSSSGISQGSPFGERTKMSKRDGGTVILPIQPSISDSNTVNWGSSEMNAGEAIAATAALSGITEGSEGLLKSITGGSKLLQSANPELKTAIAAYFAQEAAGVKGLLTRTTGAIVNPNMELLFNGPQLRNFTFSFTMSAREPKEAEEIKKIIRFFKQGMSVKRASTGLFLKTPHTFRIQYLHKNKEHPWINKIKECALTGCNVNYTPAGNYATYYDGSMTSYEISLSFGELEPIYDDDYAELVPGGNSDTHIGF